MSANSVIIKLSAEDKLTPELKKAVEELKKAQSATNSLDNEIKKLQQNKKGIVSGGIQSDIADIQKLQSELRELEKIQANSKGKASQQATRDIQKKRLEIEERINSEIRQQNDLLKKQKARTEINAKRLENEHRAIDKVTNSMKKEDAVRRSAGTSIIRHIRQVESLIVAMYGLNRAYVGTVGRGIDLNRQIESSIAGIAALISANTTLIGSTNGLDKFNAAMEMSRNVILYIKKAAVDTAATFPELTMVFQQAIGGALGAGKAMGETTEEIISNTINLSKRMTNIASAIGMPMVQVNEEIRSLIEGTIDINSRISKMIGITNKEVNEAKERAGGLVEYLNEKLRDFDRLAGINTLDRSLARLKDAYDTIVIDGTAKFFEQYKGQINKLVKYLQDNGERLSREFAEFLAKAAEAAKVLWEYIKMAVEVIKDNWGTLELFFKGWLAFKVGGVIVNGLTSIYSILQKIIPLVSTGSFATMLPLIANPVGLVATGVAALGVGAAYSYGSYKSDARAMERRTEAAVIERGANGQDQYGRDITSKLESLHKALASITQAYNDGKIPQEQYAKSKEKLTELIQKETNLSEISSSQLIAKTKLTKEQIKAQEDLAKEQIKLIEKYSSSAISTEEKKLEQLYKDLEKLKAIEGDTTEQQKNLNEQIKILKESIASKDWDKWLSTEIERADAIMESASATKKLNDEIAREREEVDKLADQSLKEANDALVNYYEKVGNYQEAWRLQEKEIYDKFVKYLGEEKAKELLEMQKKEYLDKLEKESKSTFKTIENEWDNLTSSMGQSIEDNLFNFMKDGFNDFRGLLKNLGNDILANFTSPIYKGIAGSIAGVLVPSYAGGGQTVASMASNLGLSLVNGQYTGSVNGSNVVIDTLGNVVSGGNALGDIKNIASLGNSLTNFSDIGGLLSNPMASISTAFKSMTLDAGLFVSEKLGMNALGQGIANAGLKLAPATPYLLGAGIAYSLYQAGWTDWQKKASGFRLEEDINASDISGIEAFDFFKRKKAFSAKTRYDYRDLTDQEALYIQSTLGMLQGASTALGGGDITIGAGQYMGEAHTVDKFSDAMGKAFIAAISGVTPTIEQEVQESVWKSFTQFADGVRTAVTESVVKTVENPDLTEIYKVWEDYAKAMDTTAFEAIQEYIGKVMQTQREFTMWTLQGDQVGLAEYQAQIAKEDAERVAQSLGVDFASLTAENFLARYNEAIANTFDPTIIDQWNALAGAFMQAENAQVSYINALQASSVSLLNTQLAVANAFGRETQEIQRNILETQINAAGKAAFGDAYKGQWQADLVALGSGRVDWDKVSSEMIPYINSILAYKQFSDAIANQNFDMPTIATPSYTGGDYSFTQTVDTIGDLISSLGNLNNAFGQIAETARDFTDSMFANNAGYMGGMYRTYLAEAEHLTRLVSAGNYTEAQIDALSSAVSKASEYGRSYFDTKVFQSANDELFERTVAANRFAKISEVAGRQEKTIGDIVDKLEEIRRQEQDTAQELLTLTEKIAQANERIDTYIANGGGF